MGSSKVKVAIAIVIFLILLGLVILVMVKINKGYQSGDLSCVTKTEAKTVRGDSLSGLIEEGEAVEILFDYYDCNEIELGDVIAYDYAGNPEPIIKIIKALSGNTFHLESEGNSWKIIVNGNVVKNSQGEPYVLDEGRQRMLALYERDYNGIIPEGAYLILGNLPEGSIDSTKFGLVSRNDILGMVVLP